MYEVIVRFADLQDNKHIYEVGDKFPRLGVEVSEERLAYLSSNSTKSGKPMIKKIEEEVLTLEPKVEEEPKVETIEEPKEKPKKTSSRRRSK